MKRFVVSPGQIVSVYDAGKWLDGLIGSDYKGCEIVDILSWQIVHEGKSHLVAVAMVLVEERE